MRCVVATDFNAWDFKSITEARKWYVRLVAYAEKYKDTPWKGPEGEPAEWVELWKSEDYYDNNDKGYGYPMASWDNRDGHTRVERKRTHASRKTKRY